MTMSRRNVGWGRDLPYETLIECQSCGLRLQSRIDCGRRVRKQRHEVMGKFWDYFGIVLG
jgi:hypothetical protein